MAAKKKATRKRAASRKKVAKKAAKKKVTKKKATKKKVSRGALKIQPSLAIETNPLSHSSPPLGPQAKLYFVESKSHPGLIGVGMDSDPKSNLSLLRKRYQLSPVWKISHTTPEFPRPVAKLIIEELSRTLQEKAVYNDRPIFSISMKVLKRSVTSICNGVIENLWRSMGSTHRAEISSKKRLVDKLDKQVIDLKHKKTALQESIEKIRKTELLYRRHSRELGSIKKELVRHQEELRTVKKGKAEWRRQAQKEFEAEQERAEKKEIGRLDQLDRIERKIKTQQEKVRKYDSVLGQTDIYLSHYEKKLASEVRKLAKTIEDEGR